MIVRAWAGVKESDTHWTVSASGSSKLQLSKGISGVFRGVLFIIPLADHMITCRYGCMNVPCSTTLAQSPITATERERESETLKQVSMGLFNIYYSSHHFRGRDLKRKKEINLLCVCVIHVTINSSMKTLIAEIKQYVT